MNVSGLIRKKPTARPTTNFYISSWATPRQVLFLLAGCTRGPITLRDGIVAIGHSETSQGPMAVERIPSRSVIGPASQQNQRVRLFSC